MPEGDVFLSLGERPKTEPYLVGIGNHFERILEYLIELLYLVEERVRRDKEREFLKGEY